MAAYVREAFYEASAKELKRPTDCALLRTHRGNPLSIAMPSTINGTGRQYFGRRGRTRSPKIAALALEMRPRNPRVYGLAAPFRLATPASIKSWSSFLRRPTSSDSFFDAIWSLDRSETLSRTWIEEVFERGA
jgi:hypothetical protein